MAIINIEQRGCELWYQTDLLQWVKFGDVTDRVFPLNLTSGGSNWLMGLGCMEFQHFGFLDGVLSPTNTVTIEVAPDRSTLDCPLPPEVPVIENPNLGTVTINAGGLIFHTVAEDVTIAETTEWEFLTLSQVNNWHGYLAFIRANKTGSQWTNFVVKLDTSLSNEVTNLHKLEGMSATTPKVMQSPTNFATIADDLNATELEPLFSDGYTVSNAFVQGINTGIISGEDVTNVNFTVNAADATVYVDSVWIVTQQV